MKDPLTRADVKTQLMGFDPHATIRVIPIQMSDGTAALGLTYFPYLNSHDPSAYMARDLLTVSENQSLRLTDFDFIFRFDNLKSLSVVQDALETLQGILEDRENPHEEEEDLVDA